MACPICKKASTEKYTPFCCKRCADIDLGRWLDGDYILPGNSPLEGVSNPREEEGGDGTLH